MSLYGALFAGVAGLTSQARKLGVISDNVSNVNTVGYKGGNALFQTLVTSSASTSAYSPGGVIGASRQLVSKQGLLQATDTVTDIAISGSGFFVVNQDATGDGAVFYTRSGSFRADSRGNYRNATGFYLQAWPLDREGRLPGAAGNTTHTTSSSNLASLEVVNVGSLTGAAAATTSVSIGANLNASQTVYPGSAGTITMDSLNSNNFGIAAKDIIIPGSTNSIARGDKIDITTGNGLEFTYRYGGFTHGRNVGNSSDPDSGEDLLAGTTTLGTNPFAFSSGSNDVTVTQTAHGLATGAVVTFSGNTSDIAGMDSSEFNAKFVVTVVDDDTFTFSTSTNAAATTLGASPLEVFSGSALVEVTQVSHGLSVGQSITIAGAAAVGGITPNGTFTVTSVIDDDTYRYTFTSNASANATGGGSAVTEFTNDGGGTTIVSLTRPFAGNIFDATNTESRFLGTTGTSGFTATGLTFNIITSATGTVTFSYTSSSPDVRQKQFNNLTNLAAAINEVTGLSARVVDGQIYIGATDANSAVTFENGSVLGTDGPPVQAGIDWVRELGVQNVVSGLNRFSSLEGLYNLAITDAGISASLENPLGAARLAINVDDPLDTIHFSDSATRAPLTAFTSTTPFTTTDGETTVKVTHPAAHAFTSGDFVTLDSSDLADTTTLGAAPITTPAAGADPTITVDITGLGLTYTAGELITIAGAAAVGGVDVNGTWTVVTGGATSVTFVATDETSTGVASGGGASVTASYGSFSGIPIDDLSGRFEILVTSPTEYTIEVDTAATSSGSDGGAGLVITPHNNLGSLISELGLADSLNGDTYTPQETDDLGPSYSPTDTELNMASSNTSAHFSRPIRVYDAQGGGHDLNMAFLKTAVNTWSIEVYAVPEEDVSSSLPDGLVAYGNVTFNGDGTLRSVDTTLSEAATITWTNGSTASSVLFDWGTAGQPFGTVGATAFGETDGLSQFNAAYKVAFANQNGAPVGELTGVAITELGILVASYSNGQTQNLYKIPIAAFANPDQLSTTTGNVFAQSANSGEFNLQQAGTSGVGKVASSSLEASNVELSQELTDMIVAQRSYQANAKVISTSDNMLNVLNDIIR